MTNSAIVYISSGDELFLMDGDGSNKQQISDFGNVHPSAPSLSPDGRQVAFELADTIYRMDITGSNLVQLTTVTADSNPVWSPDGTKIAFRRTYTSPLTIFVMDAEDGGNVTQL